MRAFSSCSRICLMVADPVELRHSQVEERHIGTMLFPKIHCLAAVTGFANNSHVWFTLDQRNQTFAHNAVIVGNQNSDASFSRICSGS